MFKNKIQTLQLTYSHLDLLFGAVIVETKIKDKNKKEKPSIQFIL